MSGWLYTILKTDKKFQKIMTAVIGSEINLMGHDGFLEQILFRFNS